jgi:hypothetical protein
MPVEGGEEIKVLDSVHTAGLWNISEQGIYFFTAPDEKGYTDLRLFQFAAGVTKKILTLDRSIWFAIAVSPDGRTVLYPQIDEAGSDLMMLETFR